MAQQGLCEIIGRHISSHSNQSNFNYTMLENVKGIGQGVSQLVNLLGAWPLMNPLIGECLEMCEAQTAFFGLVHIINNYYSPKWR